MARKPPKSDGAQGHQPSSSVPAQLPTDKVQRAKVIEAEILQDPKILNSPRVRAVLMEMEHYSGPVPPAKQFADYEAAVPGAGMELLAMSKRAMDAQIEHNADMRDKDFTEAGRGQWMAFMLALATIGGAIALGLNGAGWPGAFFGTGGLAAIVYLFIQGKKRS